MGDRANPDRPLLKYGKIPRQPASLIAKKMLKPQSPQFPLPRHNAQENNSFGHEPVRKDQTTKICVFSYEYSVFMQRTREYAFVDLASRNINEEADVKSLGLRDETEIAGYIFVAQESQPAHASLDKHFFISDNFQCVELSSLYVFVRDVWKISQDLCFAHSAI
jgi:hypothetical protein